MQSGAAAPAPVPRVNAPAPACVPPGRSRNWPTSDTPTLIRGRRPRGAHHIISRAASCWRLLSFCEMRDAGEGPVLVVVVVIWLAVGVSAGASRDSRAVILIRRSNLAAAARDFGEPLCLLAPLGCVEAGPLLLQLRLPSPTITTASVGGSQPGGQLERAADAANEG